VERPNLFGTYNTAYAQALYEEYLRNPAAVSEPWRRLFESGAAAEAGLLLAPGPAAPTVAPPTEVPPAELLRAAMAAAALIDAYRLRGHRAAWLDPLGDPPGTDPFLDPATYGITPEDLEALPAEILGVGHAGKTMADVLEWLRQTYTGTIGYEYEHLRSSERREWLRQKIESGELRQPLSDEDKRRLLRRLTEVEALEQFLHRAYLGQKRFSGEGTDVLVPMLDLAIESAAEAGAREVVIGMAHRGRLNVLAHVLGMPYQRIIGEFEGLRGGAGTTGDVKYHLGHEGTYVTATGERLTVIMSPNPSHLEYVNPVVVGMVRARQTDRRSRELRRDEDAVLPILIHGDAAFAGLGVVPETLNLAELDGYRVGGTVHIIVNNQIGFTTDPEQARWTRYASDIARGYGIPIFHVNADDPEACFAVTRLALAFRQRFHGDVVIDLIGYRRWGHNEGDEPAYTQPVLYRKIQQHPSVRVLLARRLVEQGVVTQEEVDALWREAHERLVAAQEEVKKSLRANGRRSANPAEPPAPAQPVETGVSRDLLVALDRQLHSWPEGFHVHPKLARALERRARVVPEGGELDWAHAESLAFASLLVEGTAVRLTGEDVERGTFSQRHLVLHDTETGATYTPLANLAEAKAPFEVHNSPLIEQAVVGFEYGYSVGAPDALVLWEAQFGDFANGAQVMIDQFIAPGQAKWGQTSRLTLLLPHGYEGQGPEHSSARVERFLQLAAEDNLRIANCTTPAQFFHLLRRQALAEERRPLIVFTPKSLLRHPRATSRLEELVSGRFQPVLDDEAARSRADEVTRVVLCTGKVYYDLIGSGQRDAATHVAIVRVEELYPFPAEELSRVLEGYPGLEELVWLQEEPANMGAWWYMEPKLRGLVSGDVTIRYVGRPERAAPAEGYISAHEAEQTRIVSEAFEAPLAAASRRGRAVRRR
jgi:2-oxoglutarate dehydrogenase E1 component